MGKLFLLFMISSFVPFNSINLNNFDSSSFYAYENNHYYLDIEIVSKYGSCWTIEVTNNSNENITFGYNAKMCGQAAARDWNSNLRDLSSTTLQANCSIDVSIVENFMASYITFSFIDGNYRYVTYANHLSASTLSMDIYYNRVYLLG